MTLNDCVTRCIGRNVAHPHPVFEEPTKTLPIAPSLSPATPTVLSLPQFFRGAFLFKLLSLLKLVTRKRNGVQVFDNQWRIEDRWC